MSDYKSSKLVEISETTSYETWKCLNNSALHIGKTLVWTRMQSRAPTFIDDYKISQRP